MSADYTAQWRTMLANRASEFARRPHALLLALVISSRSDGGMVWSTGTWEATDESMAKAMGWDERTVRKHRGVLVGSGWWVVERRGSKQGGDGVASRYRLAVPAVPTGANVPVGEKSQPERSCRPNRNDRVSQPERSTRLKTSELPVEQPVKEQPPPPPETLTDRAEQSARTETSPVVESVTGVVEDKPLRGRDEDQVLTVSEVLAASGVEATRLRAYFDDTTPEGSRRVEATGAVLASRIKRLGGAVVIAELVAWREGIEGEQAECEQREAEQVRRRAERAAWDRVEQRAADLWGDRSLLPDHFTPFVEHCSAWHLGGVHTDCAEGTSSTALETAVLNAYVDVVEGGLTPARIRERAEALPPDHGHECLACWLHSLAEPATTDEAWPPEPWDTDDDKFTWRAHCAPLAAGEF